jgi:uncharacterized protein YceK
LTRHRFALAALLLLLLLLLTGCASVNTVVRDPKTGQTEACEVTFNAMTMMAKGRCTDGTTMESKVVNGKSSTVARDRFGTVVTCGPDFNGALCWPSAQHYKPPAPIQE